jgi:hypothetical protein
MTLTEVNEWIERLERVAPRLPTLTEALHADRQLAALRDCREAMTQDAVTALPGEGAEGVSA